MIKFKNIIVFSLTILLSFQILTFGDLSAYAETIVLDDGTRITNNPDGSIRKVYPDGTWVYEYPPPNPIRKQTVMDDPDGFSYSSKIRITEYYDGRIVETKTGMDPTITLFLNGTILEYQKHWMSEGFPESWDYYYPDGSQLHISSTGYTHQTVFDEVPTIHGYPPDSSNNQNSDDSTTSISKSIPSWIKQNADWWSQGLISDKEFAAGLGYMVKERIIQIENVDFDPQGKVVISDNLSIPTWIKNNAKWWVSGAISDSDFKQGIQFMVKEKIIDFREKEQPTNLELDSEAHKKIYKIQKLTELAITYNWKIKQTENKIINFASQEAWKNYSNDKNELNHFRCNYSVFSIS